MGQGESSSSGLGFGLRRVKQKKQSGQPGEYPHINLKDFQVPGEGFVSNIGEGSFGKVTAMIKTDTKQCFAIKTMGKAKLLVKGEVQNAFNELHTLMRLPHHVFIVNLYYAFQDSHRLYMCSNLMLGGSLQHALTKIEDGMLDPQHTLLISAELVLGVQFLHANRIIHRDIKPDNILLDHNGHIRLTDFNISITVSEEEELDAVHKDGWGTKGFRAPEIYLRKGKGHVFACDWWSCGAVVYLMLTGKLPYAKKSVDESNVSLVQRMRAESFNRDRLKSENAVKICEDLLRYNPGKRLGCQFGSSSEVLIMTHPYFSDINWDRYESNAFLQQKIHESNASVSKRELPSFQTAGTTTTRDSRKTSISGGQPAVHSLEDYKHNFDAALDQKEMMRYFNRNLGLNNSLDGEGNEIPEFITQKEQQQFDGWAFNVDFILEQNSKPKFTLLQTVSTFSPEALKQYVLNSTTTDLRGLCQEMKDYREAAMHENYEHVMAEIKNDQLMQKNMQLTQEISKVKFRLKKMDALIHKLEGELTKKKNQTININENIQQLSNEKQVILESPETGKETTNNKTNTKSVDEEKNEKMQQNASKQHEENNGQYEQAEEVQNVKVQNDAKNIITRKYGTSSGGSNNTDKQRGSSYSEAKEVDNSIPRAQYENEKNEDYGMAAEIEERTYGGSVASKNSQEAEKQVYQVSNDLSHRKESFDSYRHESYDSDSDMQALNIRNLSSSDEDSDDEVVVLFDANK